MAVSRIQLSVGSTADWNQYNPDLRYGEMVIEKKDDGGAAFHVNLDKDGTPKPYSQATIIWDKKLAEQAAGAVDNANDAANKAQGYAAQAQSIAKDVADTVQQLNDKKIMMTMTGMRFVLNTADGGLDVDILST